MLSVENIGIVDKHCTYSICQLFLVSYVLNLLEIYFLWWHVMFLLMHLILRIY